MPKCDPNTALEKCITSKSCTPDDTWSSCYLRLAHRKAGQSCTSTETKACDLDMELDANLDPSIKAQVRYVIKSIYGVHEFFHSYDDGKIIQSILSDQFSDVHANIQL